ncbi:hypothetical protein CLIB1444_05S05996 [[Candida] jaroonii]|uniref:Uncharacterized protein n=1 Tax=[Candida] jaroonii TaxID=467808 RepID=A0ACA9Y8Y9_9ASCO|nr:hypothetical protein CLIB1444_05S05996 [[Candida] jaroonii]
MYRKRWKRRNPWVNWKKNSARGARAKDNGTKTAPVVQNIRKIGVNDGSFTDSASETYYQWESTHPLYEAKGRSAGFKKRGVPSLKFISSNVIAENAGDLNSHVLSSLSAPCLKILWNNVLACNNDSFSIFNSFAAVMFGNGSFRCHLPSMESKVPQIDIRQNYLRECLIPNNLTHRIENLFNNIRYHDFTYYLNHLTYDNEVVLNVSQLSLSREDLLMLFKIRNLVGLDLSNQNLDDSILHYLTISIRDGMLPRLKILNLTNCKNLSKAAIDEMILAAKNSSLSVIIADDLWRPQFHESLHSSALTGYQIQGTNWISYNDLWEHKKPILKFSMALALYYISKNLDVSTSSPRILIDIMIHNHKFEPNLANHLLDQVHLNRVNDRFQLPLNATVLMVDKSRDFKPLIDQPKSTQPDAIFTRKVTKKKPVQKRTTIKRKKMTINDIM